MDLRSSTGTRPSRSESPSILWLQWFADFSLKVTLLAGYLDKNLLSAAHLKKRNCRFVALNLLYKGIKTVVCRISVSLAADSPPSSAYPAAAGRTSNSMACPRGSFGGDSGPSLGTMGRVCRVGRFGRVGKLLRECESDRSELLLLPEKSLLNLLPPYS